MFSQNRYSPGRLLTVIVFALAISSCKNDDEVVADLQIRDMPSMSARNIETMYTDSGKVTLIMRAPLINQYDDLENPYTEFPEGVTVLFNVSDENSEARIASRYARYTKKDKVWELRDSVVAVNEKGFVIETELLFWNEEKERVWSDRFVQITGDGEIIRGTGFESDQRLEHWKIKNVTQTIIYIEDEQESFDGH